MAKAKPAQERLTLTGLKSEIDEYHGLQRQVNEALERKLDRLAVQLAEQQQLAVKTVSDITGLSDELSRVRRGYGDLEERLKRIEESFSNRQESSRNAIAGIKKDLSLALETLEKFGGESGLISQAIAKADDAKEFVESKLKGNWKSWIVPVLAVLALCGFMLFQRGCNHQGQPTPAPDEFEQSILDDQSAKAKKLTGAVVFLHDRDPMSDSDAKLLDEAASFKLVNEGFEWRSFDCTDDKNETIKRMVDAAKAKGIDPPVMVHKSDSGKISYAPMAKTWVEVVKVFGK